MDNNEDYLHGVPISLQGEDSDLLLALIEYLQMIFVEYDVSETSLASKINEIKNGKQPLHVDFNSSGCYFVCGYYKGTHENEAIDYCCATEYTWVKFEGAKDIPEYYSDAKFVVAFQINKASYVADIISEDANVPNVEHFQIYSPDFNNGLNVNASIDFDKTFIYLTASNKNNVYHSMSSYNNTLITLPCIYLDKQYYLMTELYTTYPNGERFNADLVCDFGEYYDALISVMNAVKYSVTNEKGITNYYGLFEIDDFVNAVIK